MRENPSTTVKPPKPKPATAFSGRAISMRQELVPRSMAAYSGWAIHCRRRRERLRVLDFCHRYLTSVPPNGRFLAALMAATVLQL